VKPGKVRDGFSLTGSNGMSASPTNATQTKATINVKAEALGDFTISESIFSIINIYLNGNFAVRLKALQLYIYWGALKGLNYIA